MNEEPRHKSAQLARKLRWRQYLVVILPILLILTITGGTVIYFKVQAERYLTTVKSDYQETWCKTYGIGDYSLESTREWEAFIERHREFLDSKESLHYIDPLTGERVFLFERNLKNLEFLGQNEGSYTRSLYARETVEYSFNDGLNDELASGKNEFGKSVPLACPER